MPSIQKTEVSENAIKELINKELLGLSTLVKYRYKRCLEDKDYVGAAELAKRYELGKEKVAEAAGKAYEENLVYGLYKSATEIAMSFELSKENMIKSAKNAYNRCIQTNKYESAIEITERFGLVKERMDIIEKIVEYHLKYHEYESVVKAAERFKLNEDTIKESEKLLMYERLIREEKRG